MDRWAQLDEDERFRIALDVARRRGRDLSRLSANIIGVGAGYRLRGAEPERVSEVCIRFLVRQKWQDRRARASRIPDHIVAYPLIGDRRVRVRIPTDVSDLSAGSPHAALDLTGGLVSRHKGTPQSYGSACCAVSSASNPAHKYLLSCHHVFSPTMSATLPRQVDCIVSDSGQRIGPLVVAASTLGPLAMDAALVRIEDEDIDTLSMWGRWPVSRATDFDLSVLHQRGPLFVLCRQQVPAVDGQPPELRTQALEVRFVGVTFHPIVFDYRSIAGKRFSFGYTIQYVGALRPGDSGAALIDSGGMLYGMHFFGQGSLGFAVAAPRLFESAAFGFDIVL